MKNNKNSLISLKKFIENSLYKKGDGYYMSKDPFGHKGDFLTSPNISIFFSEIIAIWILSLWENLKKPKKLNIIELGAGNGEMIRIICKTFESFPKFEDCFNIYILEKSPYLKKIQKKKIKSKNVFWINNLKKIKNGPSIFLANEFFDSLPINQYFKIKNVWHERKVQLYEDKRFQYQNKVVDIKKVERRIGYNISKNQKILEISEQAIVYLSEIGKIIKKNKGALLIIDYGYLGKKMKNTLRGIRNHKIVNILSNYQKCDITYSLSFNHLKNIIKKLKLKVSGLTSQSNFLQSLGIMKRAEIISKNLQFSKKADIFYRIEKLISKKFMGEVFKVMLITNNNLKFNIGFQTD